MPDSAAILVMLQEMSATNAATIGRIADDQREQRDHMHDLARAISSVSDSATRIETQLGSLSWRLDDLRRDHDATVTAFGEQERAILSRVSKIESQAKWVRGWSAGAVAAILAVFGAVGWVAAHLPDIERAVKP